MPKRHIAKISMKKKQQQSRGIKDNELIVWECLRRNKEYIRCHNENLRFQGIPASLDPKLTSKKIIQIAKDFRKPSIKGVERENLIKLYFTVLKFFTKLIKKTELGSSFPLGPSKEIYFQNIRGEFRFGVRLGKNGEPIEIPRRDGKYKGLVHMRRANLNSEKTRKFIIKHIPESITVSINLAYKKEDIMQALEEEVGEWINLYKRLGLRKSRTQHYSIIKRYLKVYDLRNKKNKPTFEELAEKLYPSASKKNLDSAVQQVKRECKNAKELINKGYKHLR